MSTQVLPLYPVTTIISGGIQIYPTPGGGGDPVATDPEGGEWLITVDTEGVLVTEPADGE